MAHPRWRAGKLSTGFIAEEFPEGFSAIAPEGERAQVLASVAAAIDHVLGERKRLISGQMDGRSVTRESQRAVWLGDKEYRLEVKRENGTIEVRFPGNKEKGARRHLQSDWKPGDALWTGTINSEPVAVQVRPVPNGFALAYRGVEAKAFVYTASEAGYARLMPPKKIADTGKQVLCPMPGLVVSIAVKEGQEVKAGETVAVVEAMKMENVLRAEIDGTVKKINAKPGDSLAVDAVILEFA
jgi:propionyl-CoA carboxylase alpha chain